MVFICQITQENLKVAKCSIDRKVKRKFIGLEAEAISPNADDNNLTK